MLNRREAARLDKLLSRAEWAIRQHAAEQSYRRDAMHAIKERLMASYHDNQVAEAAEIVDAIRAARADLSARLEAADEQPLPRAAGQRPGA